MELICTFLQNFLSPGLLFFILGICAGFLRSDLSIPDSISRYLSIYLMMSIGFKGGATIATTQVLNMQVMLTILFAVGTSFFLPFIAYGLLKATTRIDTPTAAAVAAHYGSISMVTFATATSFLTAHNITFAGYMVAVLALMEAPAILSGLFIAHHTAPETRTHKKEERQLCREIFTNGAILLLFGSFLIGWLTGSRGMEKVAPFLEAPFQGLLCLFLLDMGLLVSKNLQELKKFSLGLVLFGIYMPLIGALLGLCLSALVGLDAGTGLLFIVLCASASYIAVPAAIRLALPEAQPAIYLPMSLAITFPFNITIGIPLYYILAHKVLG